MRICVPAVPGICQQSIMGHQILLNISRYEDRSAFWSNNVLSRVHFFVAHAIKWLLKQLFLTSRINCLVLMTYITKIDVPVSC